MKAYITLMLGLFCANTLFAQSKNDTNNCRLKLTSCSWEVKNPAKILAEKRVKQMTVVSVCYTQKDGQETADTCQVLTNTYNTMGKVLLCENKCLTTINSVAENDDSLTFQENRRTSYEYLADTILLGYKYYKGDGDTLMNTVSLVYDQKGRKVTENHHTNKSKFPGISRFYYNDEGQLTETVRIPIRGRSNSIKTKYDCNKRTITQKYRFGNLKKRTYEFDEEYRLLWYESSYKGRRTHRTTYIRDNTGKVVKVNKVIKKPKAALENTQTEINYDANGLLHEVKYYNKPELKSVRTYSYIYW